MSFPAPNSPFERDALFSGAPTEPACEHEAWQGVTVLGSVTAIFLSVLPVLRSGSISGTWQEFVLSAIFSSVLCGLFLGALVSLSTGMCALVGASRPRVSRVAGLSGALILAGYVALRAPLELSPASAPGIVFGGLACSDGTGFSLWGFWTSVGALSLFAGWIAFHRLRVGFSGRLCPRPLLKRGILSLLLLLGLLELLGHVGVAQRSPLNRTKDLALLAHFGA